MNNSNEKSKKVIAFCKECGTEFTELISDSKECPECEGQIVFKSSIPDLCNDKDFIEGVIKGANEYQKELMEEKIMKDIRVEEEVECFMCNAYNLLGVESGKIYKLCEKHSKLPPSSLNPTLEETNCCELCFLIYGKNELGCKNPYCPCHKPSVEVSKCCGAEMRRDFYGDIMQDLCSSCAEPFEPSITESEEMLECCLDCLDTNYSEETFGKVPIWEKCSNKNCGCHHHKNTLSDDTTTREEVRAYCKLHSMLGSENESLECADCIELNLSKEDKWETTGLINKINELRHYRDQDDNLVHCSCDDEIFWQNIIHFISKELLSREQWARADERSLILKEIEKYIVSARAIKVNKQQADFVYWYDIKLAIKRLTNKENA